MEETGKETKDAEMTDHPTDFYERSISLDGQGQTELLERVVSLQAGSLSVLFV